MSHHLLESVLPEFHHCLAIYNLSLRNSNFNKTTETRYEWFSCMNFYLPSITDTTQIENPREVILLLLQNVVGICKQIAITMLH
jgi:hypothetical protein